LTRDDSPGLPRTSGCAIGGDLRWPRTRTELAAALREFTPVRLHVGCGQDYRAGYVNLDINPDSRADLLLGVDDLGLFPDACAEEIVSFHVFEHLHLEQARRTLRQWWRVLKPGGSLLIELPNLEVCLREIGRHFDASGVDLALGGLFGYPVEVERCGLAHTHQWGWTPASLTAELEAAAFVEIAEHPIEQTDRPAARFGRDMQLRARRPR
jgi:SAM-dependent methyltransferase